MNRMRTIPETLRELKAFDEGTALTEYGIRTLCKKKLIHNVTIGKKYLVNLDDLLDFLSKNESN